MQVGDIVVSKIKGVFNNLNAVAKVHKFCGDTGKMIVIPMSGFVETYPQIATIADWRVLGDTK